MNGEAFQLHLHGLEYRGRLDNYVEWVAWVTGDFFEYTYLNLVRSMQLKGCALDVGANVGNHSLAFSGMFDEVIAVEPYEPVFKRLVEKLADRPGARAFNVAFGATDGELGFAAPEGDNFGTGRIDASGRLVVKVVRGDDFLKGRTQRDIGFIKIDVEGYEIEVLKGIEATLRTHRPVVFFEAPKGSSDKRRAAMSESLALFPKDYTFQGLRGQSTFPIQRSVARTYPIAASDLGHRFAYVLALPPGMQAPQAGA